MSRIVKADGDMMELSGSLAAAARFAKALEVLSPLATLEGYTGILCRGSWAARDGGPAGLAELDAEHDNAARRAERAKDELANTGRRPQFQTIPGGVDLSGCDELLREKAAALEVETRTVMRLIHRKAIRDAAEFEAILAAVAESARDHTLSKVVAAMMRADYPILADTSAPDARAYANVAAEVRARVAEIRASSGATPAVVGEAREEIIAVAHRYATFSMYLATARDLEDAVGSDPEDATEGDCNIA